MKYVLITGYEAEFSQLYLCLDGAETRGAVGSLTRPTLEARSAPTAAEIITLSGL